MSWDGMGGGTGWLVLHFLLMHRSTELRQRRTEALPVALYLSSFTKGMVLRTYPSTHIHSPLLLTDTLCILYFSHVPQGLMQVWVGWLGDFMPRLVISSCLIWRK